MRAIGQHIIVEPIKSGPVMVGGLELSESQDKDTRYIRGKILLIGSEVNGVEVGDMILYDKNAGHGVNIDNKLRKAIKLPDIVLVE